MENKQSMHKSIQVKNQEIFLNIMADESSRTILSLTMNTPRSAQEIILQTGIPHGTIYRRLKYLRENNILKVSGNISYKGKKYFLYQSKIKNIIFLFNSGFEELQISSNHKLN